MIRVFTLAREGDGSIVEVLIVAKGRDREEYRGARWPATSYMEAKEAIHRKNERLAKERVVDLRPALAAV